MGEQEQTTESPGECECCGFRGIPLKNYRGEGTERWAEGNHDDFWFCEVCASTYLAHTVLYPDLYGDRSKLFKSLGWIANRILQEIRHK